MHATLKREQDAIVSNDLSVVLIGPDAEARRALARAFAGRQAAVADELTAYPSVHQIEKLIAPDCDVVVVDLDSDPDVALDLVEHLYARSSTVTVMVYSRRPEQDLLMRCMRAGARELLVEPIGQEALAEALIRVAARRQDAERPKKTAGRILAFWGVKGGAGVTTLASNFAIALRRHAEQEVALVDLNLELGDTAVVLGLEPAFSVADALRNPDRVDQEFVSTLMVEHRSGLAVLAAPDQYSPESLVENGNLRKLLYVLRQRYAYVVVDAGPGVGFGAETVFDMADVVYVIAEADIPSLRNAERVLAYLRRTAHPRRVELVLNRYDHRRASFGEDRIRKVLDAPLKWKVPNDYDAVSRSLNTGMPLENSPVARVLDQMAREACGKPLAVEKKRKWDLF